jgi:predicted NUDIX family NTP pyrophosphohydrolase
LKVGRATSPTRRSTFDARSARRKINPAQAELIDRLEAALLAGASF